MNYKMILEYDGTRYDGWQKQRNTDKTIQGKLERVLSRLEETPVEVHGSGRTDGGVHARGQVANFHLNGARDAKRLMEELNSYLPADIRVLELSEAPERFHSRLSAGLKTYRYQIWMEGKADVFRRNYFYSLGQRLDLVQMKAAADQLTGVHDFKSFCANKKMKKSTVRELTNIRFTLLEDGRALAVDYQGSGFLQQMVRILTGTLIEVGLGKREAVGMKDILAALDRQAAGYTAPPEGLCLMEVRYEPAACPETKRDGYEPAARPGTRREG